MAQKIIFLKGLPASGKSTWAREYCRNRADVTRLNKDDIREELGNPKWSAKFENEVLAKQHARGINALTAGRSIIIDDTNFADKHRDFWEEIANKMGIDFEQKYFDVALEECIHRDKQREKSVGDMIIRSMYNKYVRKSKIHIDDRLILEQDIVLPRCIIVDVDGTLALHNGRNPFDYKKCGTDKVNSPIKNMVDSYRYIYHMESMESDGEIPHGKIIILSGRDAICRAETEKWLNDNNIRYDFLYMREIDDRRKDDIVKQEIYEREIKDKYFVDFVLDDRDQVVKMWRDLGLLCLQVYYGDF